MPNADFKQHKNILVVYKILSGTVAQVTPNPRTRNGKIPPTSIENITQSLTEPSPHLEPGQRQKKVKKEKSKAWDKTTRVC
ncbi:MAG: hypothetical protein P8176_05405 [Gammaproteobacteria bacterium]